MLHDRLRRARRLKGWSLQQLADALGDLSKQALSKYEQGKDTPNSTRLIQIANALEVSPEYFFRSEEVELGEVDFRKHSALGKGKQESIKEQVREHLERYLAAEKVVELGSEHLKLPAYDVHNVDDVDGAANKLRREWELGVNPIANLTETLEEHGIKVVGLEAHEKFDGLCAWINDWADAVIVSNTDRDGERQRFNLAHELGHLVLKIEPEIEGTRQEENWCHRFAGTFLFPAKQVRDTFGSFRHRVLGEEFLLAKQEWGISMQATLRRLYDLGIINESFYKSTSKDWSIRGYRKGEPDALPSERSYRLKQLVYRGLAEDLITPSRAAELLDASLDQIERVISNR